MFVFGCGGKSLVVHSSVIPKNTNASDSEKPKYIGCWTGMGGGRLKITSEKIYDLKSNEESSYQEREILKEDSTKGIETGEKYFLEAKTDFPKSFLSKLVKITFNSDGTVGIIAYDTFNDYNADKFVGQGLFSKTPCN